MGQYLLRVNLSGDGNSFSANLAIASPLGPGSPEEFALIHLRLRFALGHTAARQPFYGNVSGGRGLLGAREKLQTKQGDDLKALQEKLRNPLGT